MTSGYAPAAISSLGPSDKGLETGPGTAKIFRFSSKAIFAVIKEPDLFLASVTIIFLLKLKINFSFEINFLKMYNYTII